MYVDIDASVSRFIPFGRARVLETRDRRVMIGGVWVWARFGSTDRPRARALDGGRAMTTVTRAVASTSTRVASRARDGARDVARAASSSSSASSSASLAREKRATGTRRPSRPRRETRCAFMGSGTYDSSDDGDLGEETFDDDDPERAAFELAEWTARTPAARAKDCLRAMDSSGVWTVGTTALVFVVAGSESLLAEATTEGVGLAAVMPSFVPEAYVRALDDGGIASAESCLQAIFFSEYVVRAWSEEFQLRYLRSPVALIDFLSLLPTFGFLLSVVGIGGAGQDTLQQFRPLRLFRALRLLRVLDLEGLSGDDASSSAATKRREKSQNEKVVAVAVEFLCVFLISGELFYDLEVDTNPNISDVGDAIYWSFLTLTGIGQPFEATTAQGRVATVVSILTALVVVPLQLAVLVSAQTGAQSQMGAGGAISEVPPASMAKIGLGPPMSVPDSPPADDSQIRKMMASGGNDFWLGTMDEDSQWLRLRERDELRDARKKIKAQETAIAALRSENAKLRRALDEADLLADVVGLELDLEEDIAF